MGKYRALARNTAILSVGTVLSKLVTFFMVRFYTGVLTPSEFGTGDLLITTVSLLMPFVSFGIYEGVFRFLPEYPKAKKNIFSIGIYTVANKLPTMLTLLSGVLMQAWQYTPVLCAAMLFCAFASFTGSVYTVKQRNGLSLGTSLLGAGVNIGLNLLLIPSQIGIEGAALATLASYVIVFLVRARNARRLIPFRLFKKKLILCTSALIVQILLSALNGRAGKPYRSSLRAP